MVKNYIFLGAPGVGKGTLAYLVSQRTGIIHISTGEIFRNEIKKQSTLGKQVTEILAQGKYVSDEITNQIILNRLKKADVKKHGFILDGYPRTLNQSNFLIDNNIEIDKVIVLTASDKLLIKRLSGRRTCPICKVNYHTEFLKPKVADYCDNDNALLIQRSDDEPEAIAKRLKVYTEKTQGLIEFYKNKNILDEMDGSKDRMITLKKFLELYFD